MIQLSKEIWIGTSKDAEHADLKKEGIDGLLNVAHDLQAKRGWSDGILYAQCGLVDGPGNRLAIYMAATMMLASMIHLGRKVMVYDHSGGRSVAIVICYFNLVGRQSWDYWIKEIKDKHEIPEVHVAHRDAFNKINWRLLASSLWSGDYN